MADATLDDVLADTTAEATEEASLATLCAGIKTQLDQALNGQTLSPSAQAKVNQIFANLEANKGALAAAVMANTPTAPAPATVVATGVPVNSTVTAVPPAPDTSGSRLSCYFPSV